MKRITHAWLACKAIERLRRAQHSENDQPYANSLIDWFGRHRDDVIQGAWYPDAVIKDMATSHVLKFAPATEGKPISFRSLPSTSRLYKATRTSPLRKRPATVEKKNNLPDRCESLAHSIIDNLKIIETEDRGSPVSPTDNHVAFRMFALSHYLADAHMPLHCDQRGFSRGCDVHAKIEADWEEMVYKHYSIDVGADRFRFDADGFLLLDDSDEYRSSYLARVDDDIRTRTFRIGWGSGNNNVWDFATAVCQHSYLMAYAFFPETYTVATVTSQNWRSLPGQSPGFEDLSVVCLSDAVDAIARVWLRVWRKYSRWEEKARN